MHVEDCQGVYLPKHKLLSVGGYLWVVCPVSGLLFPSLVSCV